MFLAKLNKEEGENFLELCFHLANVDGEYHQYEKNLLHLYAEEMRLYNYCLKKKADKDTLIKYFSSKSEETRKIVYFELTGMAFIDGKYEKNEIHLLKEIQQAFNISDELSENIKKMLYEDLIPWLKLTDELNKKGESLLNISL